MKSLMSGIGAAFLVLSAPVQAGPPTNHQHTGSVHLPGPGAHLASANYYGQGRYGYRGYWGYPSYGGGYYGAAYLDLGYAGYLPQQPTTIINNYYMQGPSQSPVVPLQPGVAGSDPALLPQPAPVQGAALNVVRIDINLPAEAELFIQNVKMPQTGTARRFVSPPLERGQNYTYSVRAIWKENGKELTESRQLRVRAGDHQSITFLAPSETAQAGR